MPLDANYEWKQTSTSVVLEIPLHNANPKSVDIFATHNYVKVSFEKYLLQLDLQHSIDDSKCVAKVKKGTLILKLTKQASTEWESLEQPGLSKQQRAERRKQAFQEREEREQEMAEKVKDRRVDDERKALRTQMAVEEDERQRIDDIKAKEKEQAENEVFQTFERMEREKQHTEKPISDSSAFDDLDDDALIQEELDDDDDENDDPSSSEEFEMVDYPDPHQSDELDENIFTPQPRQGGKITFNFTPRLFPTPMRESKQNEEEDWIAKNRNHLRKNPMLKPQLDALDIEDSDPTWLKGKGDDFFRARDYRAAVNAYTTALELDDSLLPVLGNRSACYLQLGELVRCIEDCGSLVKAVDESLMGPDANPQDTKLIMLKVKALARRGAAKCQQGDFDGAVVDYDRVVELTGGVESSLVSDLKRVKNLQKCSTLKREADASLGSGQLDEALASYGQVLALEPTFVSAISNRAACHLTMHSYAECVADCTKALELLQVNPVNALSDETTPYKMQEQQQVLLGVNPASNVQSMPTGPVPPSGSAKRRAWVLKTIARRGLANANLGNREQAIADYRIACSLAPEDEGLKNDLKLLEQAGLSGNP